MRYRFEKRADAQARLRSANRLIRLLLQEDSEVLPSHRKELLRIALYKVTEAEAKRKDRPRYCTKAIWDLPDVDHMTLIHEHVFQRAEMAAALIECRPANIDEVLKKAFACAVTESEHEELKRHCDADGWERYRRAGIAVVDAEKSTNDSPIIILETST